jgi:hypothetical protein
MISGGSVRTVSRFEPVCVLALPGQNKLTFGRRTRQPHHDPAYCVFRFIVNAVSGGS